MRLTPEREHEIRKQQEGPDGCFEIGELLSEIDALRVALDNRSQTQITGFCPLCVKAQDDWHKAAESSNQWQQKAIALEKERDELKAENEKLLSQLDGETDWAFIAKNHESKNRKLYKRINELRKGLFTIRDFKSQIQTIFDYSIVIIASNTIDEDDEMENQEPAGGRKMSGTEYEELKKSVALEWTHNQNLRKRIAKLREAARAFDYTWFEPTPDSGICIWCDLHCSRPYLGHDSNCPAEIAHNALAQDDEMEKQG